MARDSEAVESGGVSMVTRRRKPYVVLFGVAVAFVAALSIWPQPGANARPPATTVEEGTFRLHKFEQPIGEEKYTVQREGDELQLAVSFRFNDRGQDVPLSAFVRMAQDLAPRSMEIHGDMARGTPIDDAVLVENDKVLTRTNADWRISERPEQFFTIATYAPAALQMMLLRKWHTAGRPKKLQTFPAGELAIEDRGPDEFPVNGSKVVLERFSIADLTWGRETLWLDAQSRLAAVVTVDGEYDHFEAIRPEYEEDLGGFVQRAAVDEMAALAELSKNFRTENPQGTVALVGGTLIDGTGTPPLQDSSVIIQNGKILSVGPSGKVALPKNAQVLDVAGKTIVPGLWDMHAHFEQVEWGPVYLAAGVTTVRDCGNELEFITAVREAINSGRGLGPRLLLAGIVDGSGPTALGVARVNTPEQAREWVHRYHEAGFNQIKIYSSVKKENLEVVTAEAHKLGMTVTGHIPEGMSGFDGVNAGMDQINHITYVVQMMAPDVPRGRGANPEETLKSLRNFDPDSEKSRNAIQFLKSHGTVVDPTLAVFEMFQRTGRKPLESFEPGVAKVAPALSTQLRNVGPGPARAELGEAQFAAELKAVSALHRAGVPIVVGTDQTVPGHSVHREMELYVEAGFTPMEALQAATLVPAKVMGLEKESGTIEPGKRADLVILGANPLDNVSNIRRTEKVIQGGVVYDSAPLWQSVGFQP
jgi:imidazolonepropionase-like amidohydrolase